jgi:hypothetical protein
MALRIHFQIPTIISYIIVPLPESLQNYRIGDRMYRIQVFFSPRYVYQPKGFEDVDSDVNK